MVGQDGAGEPLMPVEEQRQRQAMQVLAEQVFAPMPSPWTRACCVRPCRSVVGSPLSNTEDPKLHDAVLNIHKCSAGPPAEPGGAQTHYRYWLYGNSYGLGEMMAALTDAVFTADARGDVNTLRQNLQVEYVQRLAKMARGNTEGGAYNSPAISLAVYNLGRIKDMVDGKSRVDVDTLAHRQNLDLLIDRALSDDI